MKRYILLLVLTMMLGKPGVATMSESTTDISYILPAFGTFTADNGRWTIEFSNNYPASTAYFCVNCNGNGESYVALRCYAAPTSKSGTPKFEIWAKGTVDTSSTVSLNISTVKRQEMVVTLTFRGSPDATYGGGTIFGYIQPTIYSAYWDSQGGFRKAGVSPGFTEGVGFKSLNIVNPTATPKPIYSFATFAITTVWTTISWRFIPIHENFFRIGFIQIQYSANDLYDSRAAYGSPFATEVQFRRVQIQVINFY